jgi:hypothetical protein
VTGAVLEHNPFFQGATTQPRSICHFEVWSQVPGGSATPSQIFPQGTGPCASTSSVTQRIGVWGRAWLRAGGFGHPDIFSHTSWTVQLHAAMKRVTGLPMGIGIDTMAKDEVTRQPEHGEYVGFRTFPIGTTLQYTTYPDTTSWRFVPDDGSPERPGCEFTTPYFCVMLWPDRSGTMQVSGYSNGEYTVARPIHVTVPTAPGLKLTCDGPTEFGQTATCTATVEGAGAPVVNAWEFNGVMDGAPVRILRASGHSSTQWSGPVVLSGTVTVRGTVGGVPTTATADLLVTPRFWESEIIRHVEKDVVPSELSDPPLTMKGLGSMAPNVMPRADYRSLMRLVATGPNTGLGYLTGIPFELVLSTDINTRAMRAGSTFWTNQPEPPPSGYCSRDFITNSLLPMITAHEGRAITDQFSHVQTFYQSFKDYIVMELASFVSMGEIPEEQLVQRSQRARSNAMQTSNAITHGHFNPARTGCRLKF